MKNTFPIIVRRGSVNVKIYRQPAANVYTVAFYEGGRRKRPSFNDLDAARREAHAVADRLARGDGNELILKDAERLEYVRAKECSGPLHVPLDTAVNEYSQALSMLNGHGSILEAVRHYVSTQVGEITPIRTEALVEDLLKARAANHASERHLRDLRSRLGRFARSFACDVHTIRPTINYGWETEAFYTRWLHGDRASARELCGAALDPLNPQSRWSPILLEIFRQVVLLDQNYIARLKRHYHLFKQTQHRSPSRTP